MDPMGYWDTVFAQMIREYKGCEGDSFVNTASVLLPPLPNTSCISYFRTFHQQQLYMESLKVEII